MTARQYLRQLQALANKLYALQEEIEHQRARLTSTTITLKADKVQTSGSGDSLADGIAALADKRTKYEEKLWHYERLRETIVLQILDMENSLYGRILYMTYVECKSRDQIAETLYYSPSYISTLHTRALAAFAEKYPAALNS